MFFYTLTNIDKISIFYKDIMLGVDTSTKAQVIKEKIFTGEKFIKAGSAVLYCKKGAATEKKKKGADD